MLCDSATRELQSVLRKLVCLATMILALATVSRASAQASVETAHRVPSTAVSQRWPKAPFEKKNGLYADLSLGVVGIAYERTLHRKFALNIAVQGWKPWYQTTHVFGFGGELRGFIFLWGNSPQGIYLSPGFRFDYGRADLDQGRTQQGRAWGGRLTTGGSVVLWDALLLRGGLGVQTTQTADLGSYKPDVAGTFLAADLYVGYVF
ncbi:MAG: hypothetical protein JWN04_4171 [Myxococcaceae bacterium]|nr:hypothetical protein [Myxococcaceae bacterium]